MPRAELWCQVEEQVEEQVGKGDEGSGLRPVEFEDQNCSGYSCSPSDRYRKVAT